MSLVVLQTVRQECLVAYEHIVNERNTRNPVTVFNFALTLNVVLSSCKVPHEVSPVHIVHLIYKEELDVFPLSRNLHHNHFATLVVRNLLTLYSA